MMSDAEGFNMSDQEPTKTTDAAGAPARSADGTGRDLPPAARRALAEAQARRDAIDARARETHEAGGPAGKEPTRYGDWELKGRAIDF